LRSSVSFATFVQSNKMKRSERLLLDYKKSFLVLNHNKYIVVPTETIAFFGIKYESTVIVTFDRQEYFIHYSLERLEQLVQEDQFFRLNRQYLINISAIKEVERYFARKLLVIPTISFPGKMIISKENARRFLDWLEKR
jgi:DNA-binding LytR/AlgR family response regulator